MSDLVTLIVRKTDDDTYAVTFDLPFGGWDVLGEFDSLEEAEQFKQEQIDSADFS